MNYSFLESANDLMLVIDPAEGYEVDANARWHFATDGQSLSVLASAGHRIEFNLQGTNACQDRELRSRLSSRQLLVQIGLGILSPLAIEHS